MLDKNTKIYVAGHHGLVGSAIWNNLKNRGYHNLIGKSHKELDLLDPVAVKRFFDEEQPEAVVLAAAHVGGIMANLRYRADFIYQNLQIQQNVIGESWKHGVKKLLFLGSTCIYPRDTAQPMPEDCLLNENDWEAVRKDVGLRPVSMPKDGGKMVVNAESAEDDIIEVLAYYGITRDAVTLWGTGKPMREFLWSEEMADASVHVLLNVDFKDTYKENINADNINEIRNCHINVGTGKEISIRQAAEKIVAEIGFKGELRWDSTKPDGTLKKLTDVTKLHELGWHHKIDIDEGIHRLFDWYLQGICINHQQS